MTCRSRPTCWRNSAASRPGPQGRPPAEALLGTGITAAGRPGDPRIAAALVYGDRAGDRSAAALRAHPGDDGRTGPASSPVARGPLAGERDRQRQAGSLRRRPVGDPRRTVAWRAGIGGASAGLSSSLGASAGLSGSADGGPEAEPDPFDVANESLSDMGLAEAATPPLAPAATPDRLPTSRCSPPVYHPTRGRTTVSARTTFGPGDW